MKKKVSGMTNTKNLIEEYDIQMWPDEKVKHFQDKLLSWYDTHKRDLPWRRTKDPYKIWVSEIMLQQTQVQTVIPYYERFIDQLPAVKDLAQADEADLLKLWEGLGYYSRVKNMQAAAKQVMDHWGGRLPDNRKDLESLKGIGPYTAGAIASIAFNQATPAIDGNAMRVFSRMFKIDADISKQKTRRLIDQVASRLISSQRPGDFNQAIMDIGSQKSTPKVYVQEDNPIAEFDLSFQDGSWPNYPVKSQKTKVKKEVYYAFIIQNKEGQYLLEKRPSSGLLADFWTFPLVKQDQFLPKEAQSIASPDASQPMLSRQDHDLLQEHLSEDYSLRGQLSHQAIGRVDHFFSHRQWTVYAFVGEGEGRAEKVTDPQQKWVSLADTQEDALAVPQQKLLNLYLDYLSLSS